MPADKKLTHELFFVGVRETVGKLREKVVGGVGRDDYELAHRQRLGDGGTQDLRQRRVYKYLYEEETV